MKLICARHPAAEAVARCIACGLHLCADCRTKMGVRNYCSTCRSSKNTSIPHARPTPPPQAPVAEEMPAPKSRRQKHKSPTLAAALSIIPGLGQAYAGSWFRGLLFFTAASAVKEWSMLTPLLGSFLLVFNLWDAYAIASRRNDRLDHKPPRKADRFEEILFTLIGFAAIGITMAQMGGFAALSSATVVPLAAIAAGILIAQETRTA